MEDYGIAAYRSRSQVLRLETLLRQEGVVCAVVSTPREVALGCGLSVRFELEDVERVRRVVGKLPVTGLIGLYRVHAHGPRRLTALTIRG